MAAPYQRWHDMSATDCASEVSKLVDSLHEEAAHLRDRAVASLSTYEGRKIPSLEPNSYAKAQDYEGEGFSRMYFNAARSIVHSVVAKVAGRTRPKSQMVASDADWQTKRKAKKLERFVEAQMSAPQGRYRDTWALALRAFQDAATAIGKGTLKIFADTDAGKITVERVLSWETYTDPRETRAGSRPLNRFQRTHYDKDLLAARYPKQADAIWRSKGDDSASIVSGRSVAQQALVYEAWRLPTAGKPGRHVVCVEGALLESEDWTRDEFPFLDVYWSEEFLGDGGVSLVEEVQPVNDELNYTAERMREKMRLCSNVVGVYEEGTVDETFLKSNENGLWIPVPKGTTTLPTWTAPSGFSAQDLEWLTLHWQKAFETSGASAAAASSQKPAGLSSGIALRTWASLETERFAVQAGAYEQMVAVDLPRHIIACARQLYDNDHNFAARWAGAGWLQEIKWGDVSMEDDMYVIQPYPVNGVANTPADRLQLGTELFNSQIIGKDAFLRIVQMKDVESELNRTNVQNTLIERYIEQWLDATPEAQADGSFRYFPPIPFMDHASAIVQVAGAYMQAQLDGAPEWNLQFFLMFMSGCDAEIKKIQQFQASLQPRAGAAAAPQAMTDMAPQQVMQ